MSRYGAPQRIFCDNGNTYTANLWKDLNRVLGIEVQFVPLYHQQTNGAIERQHRTLKDSIKASLVEMGDVYKQNWMSQLPLTLLGRRVSLQPELEASPSDLVLGGGVTLPGVLVPDHPTKQTNQQLLVNLQQNAAKPAVQMSRHSAPEEVVEPKDFQSATHVYVRVDKPENLGQKFQGPFPIIKRPSNTTLIVQVGLTKQGEARLECHHWHNCRIAYLRPGAPIGQRPDLGRRPRETNVNINKPDATNDLAPKPVDYSQLANQEVTQPRYQSDQTQAAPAEAGSTIGFQPSLDDIQPPLSALDLPVTGPPRQQPFPKQKQFSPATPDEDRQASTSNGAGPAPPASNGVPSGVQPNLQLPAPAADAGHMSEHDYARQQSLRHLADHDYFARPPPGFDYNQGQGRPVRNRQLPSRFRDYEM